LEDVIDEDVYTTCCAATHPVRQQTRRKVMGNISIEEITRGKKIKA
jgi:hypothetical protein